MVFMPPRSLVLVNKSEVLPKSLDKQSSRETGRAGTSAGKRGAHEPGLQTTLHTWECRIPSSAYPLRHRDKFGCPTLQREVYLTQLLSLNLMETPSLNLTNVKKQSLPMVFKPLLL